MAVIHLVARCEPPHEPLLRAPGAFWLWDRLRELIPDALAVVLMPNHLHVLCEHEEPELLRLSVARMLGQWRRLFGPPGFAWEPVPMPELVQGRQKILRSVRYVILNPCRAGLTQDPLDWVFSTHRDLVGAVFEPWTRLDHLVRGWGLPWHSDVERWHRWVSADPSVRVDGSEVPRPAKERDIASQPLADLIHAAASACRGLPGDIRSPTVVRRLFIALAHRQGWGDTAVLARACGLSDRSVLRLRLESTPAAALAAASLCLGDARLRSLRGLELADADAPSRPRRARHRPKNPAPVAPMPQGLASLLRRLGIR